jgi:uncharacterized alkaline shock family protein YloU
MESKQNSNTGAGSLKVSEEVVAKIAILAASEVEGVALEADGKRLTRQKIRTFAGKVLHPVPARVKLFKEAAEIDIAVVTLPGHKAAAIGENIQQAVKSAVQSMTGIAVSKINVKISGIRLGENV